MPVVLGAASAFTSRRLAAYGIASTIAAFAITLNAFRQRPNFYSATVMLGGSNGCMMVLINFGLFLTLCFGKLCQKVFFGPLRAVEIEHLHERLWYAITETLLAMTIFRDDFDSSFAILFGTLLFLKVFHWLSADRVEYMEQTPAVGRLFHVRMISVLSMLFEFDLFLATFAVEVLIIDKDRKGIMIMFANEFFILGATLWSTIAKYLINCQDMRSEEPWEAKSLYVFFVDLITDFLKLATYIACFCLILSYYGGLPLHIFRDVYVTGLSFFSRLRDFMKYRAATRNMDTRFPDATAADLRSMSDGTCIICREEMVSRTENADEEGTGENATEETNPPTPTPANSSGLNETPKKLPCGHIFHFYCLRSWLERQQSCPTCRRTVFATNAEVDPTQVPGQGRREAEAAGAGAAAAGQPEAGIPGGNSPAQNRQVTGNANQTARDHLQAFLQQIQSDAQRMRQEHFEQTQQQQRNDAADQPSSPRHHSEAVDDPSHSTSNETNSGRNDTPARRMLVNSLFNVRPGSSSSARNRQEDGYARRSNFSPVSLLPGLANHGLDRSDDPNDTYIPPPPWTLRSNRRPHHPSNESKTSQQASAEVDKQDKVKSDEDHSNNAPVQREEKQDDENEKVDPVDAREAARAAALRRFQNQRNQASASAEKMKKPFLQTTSTCEVGEKPKEAQADVHPPAKLKTQAVSPTHRASPGNPHLIPLFDTSLVEGYESNHANQLPYPLIQQQQPSRRAERTFEDRLGSINLRSLSLSDQELKTLSKRTRQGLEERLRLLYRVEGAVGDLVEELTRALSALPSEDDMINDNLSEENDVVVEENSLDLNNDKGKAPIEGIHAQRHI